MSGGAVKHVWSVVAYLSHLFVISILVFAATNLLLWQFFQQYPAVLADKKQQMNVEYRARLEAALAKWKDKWYGLRPDQWNAWAAESIQVGNTGGNRYADFVMFKPVAFMGKFYKLSEHGFRHVVDQGPWPPEAGYYNIFFFGGSTLLGIGPYWTALPSLLQQYLNNSRVLAKPVKVYNFGTGSYFSTQEKIRFQNLLLERHVPDGVVFLDGLNDFYFVTGRPSGWGWFEACFRENARNAREYNRHHRFGTPRWEPLRNFIRSLPVFRAGQILGRRSHAKAIIRRNGQYTPPPIDRAALVKVCQRYIENAQQINAIAMVHDISAAFVWQPVPGYKYDLRHHVALNPRYGMLGHERSGYGYPIMRSILKRNPLKVKHFIWAADIQENRKEPLYVDAVHYTAQFSKVLVKYIADRLIADGFFPKDVLLHSAPKTESSGAAGKTALSERSKAITRPVRSLMAPGNNNGGGK